MLVLIEKSFLAHAIHAQLTKLFPSEQFTYLAANSFGCPFVFNLPSKLHWHEYPLWRDASYRLNSQAQWQGSFKDEKWVREDVNYDTLARQDVIAIPEAGPSSVLATKRMVEHLQSLGKVVNFHGYRVLHSLAEGDVAKALHVPIPEEDIFQTCLGAQLKADFEFSFLVNASGLLTRSYQAAAGDYPNPVFSKYTVQVLYALRAMGPQAEGDVHTMLGRWKGTGRYLPRHGGIGSATSRGQLLDNLIQMGLVTRNSPPSDAPVFRGLALSLTELGRNFLSQLHPDCEDPDLPFRLELWTAEPTKGRIAAQRYLRTWFGKQKRFRGKVPKA